MPRRGADGLDHVRRSEDRFALFLANEELGVRTYPSEESECAAMRSFGKDIPNRAGVLLRLSYCADGADERISFQREALAADPEHYGTLLWLTGRSALAHLPPADVAHHAAALYTMAYRTAERLRAASLAYAAFRASGDPASASICVIASAETLSSTASSAHLAGRQTCSGCVPAQSCSISSRRTKTRTSESTVLQPSSWSRVKTCATASGRTRVSTCRTSVRIGERRI